MPALTYRSSTHFHVRPLSNELSKESMIGAEIIRNDISGPNVITITDLDESDRELFREAVFEHSAVVIRQQQGIDPNTLPALASIWDETVQGTHSGDLTALKSEKTVLSANKAERIPRASQVTVIGEGRFDGYEGLPTVDLHHVNHLELHAHPLTQDRLDDGETRFYRWHCDAPLYDKLPGQVTLLHAVVVPNVPQQKITFEDGAVMSLAAGATAFVSGARAFQQLLPSEQEFAVNTVVEYAPRAYEWISRCKATSDGLSIPVVGNEKLEEELTTWEPEKVQALPMAWRNPVFPSRPSLQILGMCVKSLVTLDARTGKKTRIDDLAEVRRICYSFQRRMMKPELIYTHDWQEGDLVIFHNQGVWHTITGQLEGMKRLMWQCTMASGMPPQPVNPGLRDMCRP